MNYLFSLLCEEVVDCLLELSVRVLQRRDNLAQIREAQVLQRRNLCRVNLLIFVQLLTRFLLLLLFLKRLFHSRDFSFQVLCQEFYIF
jgi:hypothetical protein